MKANNFYPKNTLTTFSEKILRSIFYFSHLVTYLNYTRHGLKADKLNHMKWFLEINLIRILNLNQSREYLLFQHAGPMVSADLDGNSHPTLQMGPVKSN